MADNAHFYGFRYERSLSGKPQPEPLIMPIASGYQPQVGGATNVDLHVGDPVVLLSTGYINLAIGSEGTQSAIFGIIQGFTNRFSSEQQVMTPTNKYVGGTAYSTNFERQSFALVQPVVDSVFSIDCDDSSTATTYAAYLAFFGENTDHVLVADTTNANDPKADPKLDISLHNTTALQWRILGVKPYVPIDYSGLNVKLLVTCNKVQQAPYNTTGV